MFESSEQTRRCEGHFGHLELRQERDVRSMATNRPISERVQHGTAVCRRQAASKDLKKIGFYKHSAPTEPRRRICGSVFANFATTFAALAVKPQEEEPQSPQSEATQRSQRKSATEPPPVFGMSGYGQASLTALRSGKPE